jgi:hypothetical protein
MDEMETCPGCGLQLPRVDGPTDPYSGASPSCWAAFGELRAREFLEPFSGQQRSTTDAYMAQHPGYATAAGRRSVIVHLVGLCLSFEEALPLNMIVPLLGRVFPTRPDVAPLLPIPSHGAVTVESVRSTTNAADRARASAEWAHAVWIAWAAHHAHIRALARSVK